MSPAETTGWGSPLTNSRPDVEATLAGGSEEAVASWYRQVKATKRGEKGIRDSEPLIVPVKAGNGSARTRRREGVAGLMEPLERKVSVPQRPKRTTSTKLQRVATQARMHPQRVWTNLGHLIDADFLWEAHQRIRKNGAPGVDGQTAREYERDLESNLASLEERYKSGRYRAPPVRRVHIPKDKGKTRPIGIPTYEDKVLQRAVTMLLEPVYEEEFLPCSYGFRPGRSAHDALRDLRTGLMQIGGGIVLEIDIQSFFDEMDHATLRAFLDKRIRDGVIRRVIGKWLKAGVLEDGNVTRGRKGSPQGGVISPLLANIYLHEVLDLWFQNDVLPRMRGQAFMVRYADDATLVFANADDAHRVFKVIAKRFAKFGLTLHPEKTRLVDFRRNSSDEPPTGSRTFDFLGFTHHWATSRRGYRVVKQRTAKDRLCRSLHAISEWCRLHRHAPIWAQWRILCSKVRGHFQYYGITGNSQQLNAFQRQTCRHWRRWLNRRSQSGRMPWDKFNKLLERYPLPAPRIVHHFAVARP